MSSQMYVLEVHLAVCTANNLEERSVLHILNWFSKHRRSVKESVAVLADCGEGGMANWVSSALPFKNQ